MKKLLGCLGIGGGLLVVIGIIGAVIGINSDRGKGDSVQAGKAVSTGRDEEGKTGKNEASPTEKKSESEPKTVVDAAEIQGKRDDVIGKTFATLTLGERQFSNATVESIETLGIKLKHDSGLVSLRWDQVPEEVQKLWGYDAKAFEAGVAAQEKAKEEAEKQQQEMAAVAKRAVETETTRKAKLASGKSAGKWYIGGTLHKASADQWKVAKYDNKLATAADFALASKKVEMTIERSGDINTLRPFADAMVIAIDKACEGSGYETHPISEIAAACAILMEW